MLLASGRRTQTSPVWTRQLGLVVGTLGLIDFLGQVSDETIEHLGHMPNRNVPK